MSIQARTPIVLLATVLALGACRSSPRPPMGHDNDTLVIGRLAQVNPRDVVVMPIANQTGRLDVPTDAIRQAFQEALVTRLYSPLSLEYVDLEALDPQTMEASYEVGSLDEQAVLQVTISSWDDSNWDSRARLVIEGEVHLLDASQYGGGEALWGGPVSRTIDLDLDPTALINNQRRIERAVDLFAAQVLASLPARDPRR
jgi:hypothetical protein